VNRPAHLVAPEVAGHMHKTATVDRPVLVSCRP
jgi:hypothetical protein